MRPPIDRKILRYSTPSDCKLAGKAVEGAPAADSGFLEGYAAVFNEVDLLAEIIRPGAFLNGLKERIDARKVKLMNQHLAHGGGTREVVGTVVSAEEDDYGLKIRAEYADTQAAKDVRAQVNDRHVNYLSVGYLVTKYLTREADTDAEKAVLGKYGADEIRELLEMELDEVTVTPFPVQPLATITHSKSLERPRAPKVDTKASRLRRLSCLGVR